MSMVEQERPYPHIEEARKGVVVKPRTPESLTQQDIEDAKLLGSRMVLSLDKFVTHTKDDFSRYFMLVDDCHKYQHAGFWEAITERYPNSEKIQDEENPHLYRYEFKDHKFVLTAEYQVFEDNTAFAVNYTAERFTPRTPTQLGIIATAHLD